MSEPPSTVYVVDDDAAIRRALRSLIRSAGLQAQLFASPREFLDAMRLEEPSCLILDVRLQSRVGLIFNASWPSPAFMFPSSSLRRTPTFECRFRR